MRSITAELRAMKSEIAKRAEEKQKKLEAFKQEALVTLKGLLEERGWETKDLDFKINYANLYETRGEKVAEIQVQPKGFKLFKGAFPAKCRLVFPFEKNSEWIEETLELLLEALLDPYRWDEIKEKKEKEKRRWKRWLRRSFLHTWTENSLKELRSEN